MSALCKHDGILLNRRHSDRCKRFSLNGGSKEAEVGWGGGVDAEMALMCHVIATSVRSSRVLMGEALKCSPLTCQECYCIWQPRHFFRKKKSLLLRFADKKVLLIISHSIQPHFLFPLLGWEREGGAGPSQSPAKHFLWHEPHWSEVGINCESMRIPSLAGLLPVQM